jgi:hypothetical protein
MAARVAANVTSRVFVIPLGVPPEKTKATKYLYPEGGKSFGKIKGVAIF